ncbi:TlpA disulfide reductase family protein [uncultured Bacteroides sp.]|uniref:TlpA disulfide reductase family protein n=2 Tax=uncultured Bacteroides sp. TaxID=162156 RepID=UPI002632F41F|nr:TlpA disulfide reductase family protein [uncultured Bacteroides sp.]
MKKFTYLLAVAAMMTACSGNKGYVVTGTVEGGADGETVYLQKREKRNMVKLDSAVITNGTFTFKGTQDTAMNCYVIWAPEGKENLLMNFFLENGNINIELTRNNDSATGTPNNNAYQEIRSQINEVNSQLNELFKAMSDTALTAEQREAKMKEVEALTEKMSEINKKGVFKNITNAVGIQLLKENYYDFNVEELDPLMPQIPAQFENDEMIIQIKENVEKMKATAVGRTFTDFTMNTPEGEPVKLSDYVGKGKVVLVDFWASWCGPCRREMPNLVEAYAKYKDKGFEIVGVSLDQNAEAWKSAIEKLNITWPQMSDLKYWNCEGARLYAVSSIPHVVLIDGEGTIIARGLHGEKLLEKLAEVIK